MADSPSSDRHPPREALRNGEAWGFISGLPKGPSRNFLELLYHAYQVKLAEGYHLVKEDVKDPRSPQSDIDVAFAVFVVQDLLRHCDITVAPRDEDDWGPTSSGRETGTTDP